MSRMKCLATFRLLMTFPAATPILSGSLIRPAAALAAMAPRVCRPGRDDPSFGKVPPLYLPVPQSGVGRVDQVMVSALPVPHLPPGVPRISEDRRDRAQRPRCPGPVRITAGVGGGRARDPCIVQGPGDPRGAVPGQPPGEHPLNNRRRSRVGLELVRPPAPCRVCLVRVRPGVGKPVPVRRAAAEIPALLAGLGGHRGPDPDPGAGDLPLGLEPQRQHQLLMILTATDRAACLRHPQRDAVMLKKRRHGRVLAGVERPLVFSDHDRVPPAVRVRQHSHQGGGLRPSCPRQRTALPGIEELSHHLPVPGHQSSGLGQLPGAGGHRILAVLGRDPPVKREPQTTATRLPRPAPAGAPRPRRQRIPSRAHGSAASQLACCRHGGHLSPPRTQHPQAAHASHSPHFPR